MKNDRENIKCVLVGDTGTWWDTVELLKSYINDDPPVGKFFHVYENWEKNLNIDDKPIYMTLWNTSGQDDYDRLRPLSYPNTNVFMLIFSITYPDSFERIRSKFYPEIKHHAPEVPFILVGIHLECRNDIPKQYELQSQGVSLVTKEAGQKMAKNIGAQQYLECSALTQEGLSQAFETAARIGLASKKENKAKHCSLFQWTGFFGKQRKDKDHGPSGKNQPKNIASKPR